MSDTVKFASLHCMEVNDREKERNKARADCHERASVINE